MRTGTNRNATLVWLRQSFYHQDPQRSGFLPKAEFLRVVEVRRSRTHIHNNNNNNNNEQGFPSGKTLTDPDEQELIKYCGISNFNNKVPYDPFIHLLVFEDPEVDVLAQTMRNAIRREMSECSKREDATSALKKTEGSLIKKLEHSQAEVRWRSSFQVSVESSLQALIDQSDKSGTFSLCTLSLTHSLTLTHSLSLSHTNIRKHFEESAQAYVSRSWYSC